MDSSDVEAYPLLDDSVVLRREFLLNNAYLKPGDSAFVGGSLIEGIGNRYSDVDVHVICDVPLREREVDVSRHYRVLNAQRSILNGSDPDSDVFLIHTVIPATTIKVDIEYRTADEIDQLANSLIAIYEYATASLILLTKCLPVRDLAFIHRLFKSKDLYGSAQLNALRDLIGLRRFLYLMYRWKASDFSVLIDVLGAWENGELDRCVDLARENAVAQFHAYTHLLGNSNYHRKWIIPYARSCGVSDDLMKRYLGLLLGRDLLSDAEKSAFVLDTMDFVDLVFDAGAKVLASIPSYPSGAQACARLDSYLRSGDGEYSEMEVSYRKKAYGGNVRPTRSWFVAS